MQKTDKFNHYTCISIYYWYNLTWRGFFHKKGEKYLITKQTLTLKKQWIYKGYVHSLIFIRLKPYNHIKVKQHNLQYVYVKFNILAKSTRQVRPVNKECLILLGTWSHLNFLEVHVALSWICITLYGFLGWSAICYCHFVMK